MRAAVFTMAFNESVFLPIWLEHYGAIFGYENCFVIDDGSTDGSAEDARVVNRIAKQHAGLDEDDRALLVSFFHLELLDHYDTVIFADTDEFIVVDPATGFGLREYLAFQNFTYKTPIGFEVVHWVQQEAPLHLDGFLFDQRSYLQFNLRYCKSLISRVPMAWRPGFHATDEPHQPPAFDQKLLLFHLRAMDYETSRNRIHTLNQVVRSDNAKKRGHSVHFGFTEAAYLQHLYGLPDQAFVEASHGEPVDRFRQGPDGTNADLVHVPERFRASIRLADPRKPSGANASAAAFDRGVLEAMFANALDKMIRQVPNRQRNDPCPCGSGKKFKKCHGAPG
jgi:hypothetical protein